MENDKKKTKESKKLQPSRKRQEEKLKINGTLDDVLFASVPELESNNK